MAVRWSAAAQALICALAAIACGSALGQQGSELQRAEEIVAAMAERPERIVGQVCMVGIWGNNFDSSPVIREKWEQTVRLVQRYHVGSVILFETNFSNVPKPGVPSTPEQVISICRELERLSHETATNAGLEPVPLFISVDHEGDGRPWTRIRTGLTPIPSNMAIAATWDTDLCEQIGEVLGSELSLLGINMLLGPVLDVNADATKDAMGERCFGGHPGWVGRMGCAYIRGVHKGATDQGKAVAVVAKHWPGHGDCDRLSDYEVARIGRPLTELGETELAPFLTVTNSDDPEARPDALMPTHSVYTALQAGHNPYPLTLDIVGDVVGTIVARADQTEIPDLLRQRLRGLAEWREQSLIVSDALGVEGLMIEYTARGYRDFPYADAACRCLLAGHDIVMLTGYEKWERQVSVIEHLTATYRRGISPGASEADRRFAERVKDAAKAVVAAKLRLSEGQAATSPGPAASQGKDLEALQSLVAEHTTALYQRPESTWHKAVQWVKGKDMPGPTANESIVTVEPQAFDRIASGTVEKGFLADMLSRKQPRAPDSTLERLSAAEVRALLTGDEPEMKAHAQQLLAKARWVIILLGHRPRTPSGMEEAGGIDTVKWSLQLVRKLPVLRPGAQKPRVAVIACQVPYYLDESDIAAVDVYLITHTKLERYVELAVDALLGAGDAGGLLSPVSIPGARYDVGEKAPTAGVVSASTAEGAGEEAGKPGEPDSPWRLYWWVAVVALVVAGAALVYVWRWHRLRSADYARLPEVLYTFLAVDVRGSTRLKAGRDPVSVRRTFDAYHEWIRETVRGHHGEVYSTSGDGVLSRFARAGDALEAARELRASLDTFNAESNQLPEPLLVGMGLHTGPVLATPREEHGTVSSTTLDLAMKLQAQAEPREILLSGETVVRLPSRKGITEAGRMLGEIAVYRVP